MALSVTAVGIAFPDIRVIPCICPSVYFTFDLLTKQSSEILMVSWTGLLGTLEIQTAISLFSNNSQKRESTTLSVRLLLWKIRMSASVLRILS